MSKAGKPAPAEVKKGTAVAAAASTALSTSVIDFSEDAGAGLEGADKDSYAIPFLAVLQPMSPAVLEEEIDGAKPGLFINTVSNALYAEPMLIPCAFQRRWIRWAPRDAGGGYKGELSTAEVNELREKGAIKELDGRLYFPSDDGSVNPKKCDRLADTRSHFVLIVDGPDAEFGQPAVFALSSTGIKVSKNWLSRIESKKIKKSDGSMATAPTFSHVYRATTEKKTNDQGTWWQPSIEPVGDVLSPSLYAAAKAFYGQVTAGKVQVNHGNAQNAAPTEEGAEKDSF